MQDTAHKTSTLMRTCVHVQLHTTCAYAHMRMYAMRSCKHTHTGACVNMNGHAAKHMCAHAKQKAQFTQAQMCACAHARMQHCAHAHMRQFASVQMQHYASSWEWQTPLGTMPSDMPGMMPGTMKVFWSTLPGVVLAWVFTTTPRHDVCAKWFGREPSSSFDHLD